MRAGFIVCALVACLCGAGRVPADSDKSEPQESVLYAGPYAVRIAANGGISEFTRDGSPGHAVDAPLAGEARYGRTTVRLDQPVAAELDPWAARFTYTISTTPAIKVLIRHTLRQEDSFAILKTEVLVRADGALAEDLTVRIPLAAFPLPEGAWLPKKNGTAGRLGANGRAAYKFAGKLPADGEALAMPMATYPGGSLASSVTVVTDVYFSTLLSRDAVEWTYPKEVGLENGEERRTIAAVFHDGGVEKAIEAFYAVAVPEVRRCPDWMYDVAMVGYDYMSDDGKGWFRDIDALCEAIPAAERGKVFLCLHGWYDWIGRYCFDMASKRFDREWTAFGNYENVKTFNYEFALPDGEKIKAGFENNRPVKLTLDDMHRRIAHAKSRGFRVGLYYATGVQSCDALENYAANRVLAPGGWTGPDMKGKPYVENVLLPSVYDFYPAYMDALLAEYGGEVDAFVWDTTHMVPAGSLGTKAHPGYADRAMMRLMRDVAVRVQEYGRSSRRSPALMSSDMIGAWGSADGAPYSLMSHGTYQDSHCRPHANSFEIFPNYRNVFWSCNWWPVRNWRPAEFGVRQYQTPVPIGNGFGDDVGFAEMTAEQRTRVVELFNYRKTFRTRLKWLETLPACGGTSQPTGNPGLTH